jgi:hypothetical protein
MAGGGKTWNWASDQIGDPCLQKNDIWNELHVFRRTNRFNFYCHLFNSERFVVVGRTQ